MNSPRRAILSALLIAVIGQAADHSRDEGEIKTLVGRYMDARNGKDADATRKLFTPDADQLVSTGEWRKGLDALVKGAMASSQKEAAKSSIQVETVRFLDNNAALVDGRYETVSAATGDVRKMRTTLVVVKTSRGWRIAAIRNMLPTATAGH
jgi:uncharacterized protein (TIGR02246 family)